MTSEGSVALIVRLGAGTALVVTAFAMSAPVLAVLLQQSGHSTSTVGAFAMIPFLLVGLLIPLVPRALDRWGLVRVYQWGALLQLVGVLGYALGDSLPVWAASSVVGGVGAAALWNATEALLAREAPADSRGRVMGLYQTALGGALALGPFMPALLQIQSRSVLWLAAALMAVGCGVALSLRHASSEPPRHLQSGMWQALRKVPWMAHVAFVGGVFEAGLGSVSAAYASATGMTLGAAASVAGVIGVGSFLCQYPAGFAADHFRMRKVVGLAAALLLVASLCLAGAGVMPWLLWPVGAVWGGVGGALYTLSMVQVARVFAGRATAGGAAAMITGYTVGGTVGPLASGAALQFGGPVLLSVLLSALAASALWSARRLPEHDA